MYMYVCLYVRTYVPALFIATKRQQRVVQVMTISSPAFRWLSLAHAPLADKTGFFGCVLLVHQPLCHLKSGCVPPILFLALALSPLPVEPFDSGIEQGEKKLGS